MKPGQLYGLALVGIVALFSISTIGAIQDYRAESARKSAFFQGCQSESFVPSPASPNSCTGLWRDAPLVLAFYPGSEDKPTMPGILVSMLVGTHPELGWGAELNESQPRLWGSGPGEAQLRSLLTPDRLLYAQGMPSLALMPYGLLLPDAELRLVAEQRWPGTWRGLVLRNMMPQNLPWRKLHESFEKMYQFRVALIQAG